jgi:uncharacterized damage-inducible protein DinB
MALKDALLPEFDHEMANTRKTLERVPEDKLGWKPHPKSGTMGWLATHVANLPSWATETLGKDTLDLAPNGVPQAPMAPAKSRQELLALFDKNVAAGRAAIAGASDEHFAKPWSLLSNGKTLMTMPRIAVLRGFVMNHVIHHRAQLGVYLRLNDVAVPALYGPSADEQGM